MKHEIVVLFLSFVSLSSIAFRFVEPTQPNSTGYVNIGLGTLCAAHVIVLLTSMTMQKKRHP